MPKISLILPLYNAVKYLKPCLDSVTAQTFDDFECLCVNDGSTDGTVAIVQKYIQKDKRFVLLNKQNGGVSDARNFGLQTANAPYVAFLDQDDLLHPQALEVLYALILEYKTDIAGFAFRAVPPSFEMPEKAPIYYPSTLKAEVSKTPLQDFLKTERGGAVEVWTRLYRVAALEGVRFPKDVQPAEDTVFTLKAFAAARDAVFVEEPLLYYRNANNTSVMARGVTEKYLKSHESAAIELYGTFLKGGDKDSWLYKRMDAYISRMVFKTLISRILKREKSKRAAMLATAHALVHKLYTEDVFHPAALSIRRRAVSKLFLKGRFKLARLAQM